MTSIILNTANIHVYNNCTLLVDIFSFPSYKLSLLMSHTYKAPLVIGHGVLQFLCKSPKILFKSLTYKGHRSWGTRDHGVGVIA
jgi:hypothetical protein